MGVKSFVLFAAIFIVAAAIGIKLLLGMGDKLAASPNANLTTEHLTQQNFDFIVVGAGSAGAALAYRLAENGKYNVLLLEGGENDNDLNVKLPPAFPKLFKSDRDYNFYTEPSVGMSRKLYWPRGKMLGGSSSMNAMIYIRGNKLDFDEWAAVTGDNDWSYEKILSYFKRLEGNTRKGINTEYHSSTGPNIISDLSDPHASMVNLVESISSALQIPKSDDLNGAEQIGVGITQTYTSNGARFSTADAYLSKGILNAHKNLFVRTNAMVSRVIFDKKRAIGVEFFDANNKKSYTVKASREVILSAGAVQSPQLLMLSGVGPSDVLSKFNIDAIHVNEAVGKNLKDHPNVPVAYKIQNISSLHTEETLGNVFKWLSQGKGALTSNIGELSAFFRTKYAKAEEPASVPDMQIIAGPVLYVNHGFRYAQHADGDYATTVCVLLKPESTGYLTLSSKSIFDAPKIHANYFENQIDVQRIAECLKSARSAFNTAPINKYIIREAYPGSDVTSDEQFDKYIREEAETLYHPTSTCRMGKSQEENAVVDSKLRVFGVEGLRVADASVMPDVIRGNTNAATILIGEKAADMILSSYN